MRGLKRWAAVIGVLLVAAGMLLAGAGVTTGAVAPAWRPVPVHTPSLPRPIAKPTGLTAVGCPRHGACTAIGTYLCEEPDGCGSSGIPSVTFYVQGGGRQARVVPTGEASMDAISCAAADDCVAVGQSLRPRRDGGPSLVLAMQRLDRRGRRSIPVADADGAEDTLRSIACPSRRECVAVGLRATPAGSHPLIATLTGSRLTLQIFRARGALSSVACARVSDCTAVGSLDGGLGSALIETWDGRRWTAPSAPAGPGSALRSVACPSANVCLAIGDELDAPYATADSQPLGERWDGRRWSLVTVPQGLGGTVIACRSASACVAVGAVSTIGTWNGSAWSVQTARAAASPPMSPSPPDLTAVSCTVRSCLLVGQLGGYMNQVTYALTGTTSFRRAGTGDERDTANAPLAEISCQTARVCLAIGHDFYTGRAFVERFDGTAWRSDSRVSGQLAHAGVNPLAVSCPAAGCVVLGSLKRRLALVGLRNPQPHPIPETTAELPSSFDGSAAALSCASDRLCAVAVTAPSRSGAGRSLLGVWQPGHWRITPIAPLGSSGSYAARFPRLTDVSCATSRSCTAVGVFTTDAYAPGVRQVPLIEHFDGHGWVGQRSAVPAGARESHVSLTGVSCPSADRCVAVGDRSPVVEEWNGRRWSALPTPSAGRHDGLRAVSCSSAGSCGVLGGDPGIPRLGYWNGSSWSDVRLPDPTGGPLAIACPTADACQTVGAGNGGDGAPTAASYTAPHSGVR